MSLCGNTLNCLVTSLSNFRQMRIHQNPCNINTNFLVLLLYITNFVFRFGVIMAPRRCCVPSCTVTQGDGKNSNESIILPIKRGFKTNLYITAIFSGISLHGFPNPSTLTKPQELERFRTWVMRIGGDIAGEDDLAIFRNRRVCHRHFEAIYTFPNQRITRLATYSR